MCWRGAGNTGYAGPEPRRIWDAIYNENCFHTFGASKIENMCLEDRVFFRLISGLHTSITTHVFARWKKDPETGMWLGNQGLWNQVVAKFPERLDNLYFTLAFLLRAVQRMDTHLRNYKYVFVYVFRYVTLRTEPQSVSQSVSQS